MVIKSFHYLYNGRNRQLSKYLYRMTDYDHFWILSNTNQLYERSYRIELLQNKMINKSMKSLLTLFDKK